MRIAVIGAGAVGSVLGSLLWRAGEDVVLVGRAAHVAAIRAAWLNVEGKGSTWQSVARGRQTEVEYLNGEIVRLGRELGVPTPLNALVMSLMEEVAARRHHLSIHELERAVDTRLR